MSADPPPDPEPDDADVFVEVDPTGRYGRYREVLGKGAFKKVYKAFDELEGIEVAWNQVKVTDLLRNSVDMERLFSEVHLLKTLKHKNIIKFYNSWADTKRDNINFITEVFTSGTLRQYRMKHQHVDIRALKNWSRQILSGLLYLHSHDPPVIHRDLKCDNIFVNGNQGEVKIGDLGLAAILGHTQSAHSVIGTPEFMAPELYEEEYNELIDIYAFGMCLLEMVTFEYPYCECSNPAQIFKKVTSVCIFNIMIILVKLQCPFFRKGVKPASLSKVQDPDIKQFIEKCIAKAPERLPARDLLMDPFLRLDPENGSVRNSSSSDLNKLPSSDLNHRDNLEFSNPSATSNSSSSDLNKLPSSDLNHRDNLEFSNPSATSNTDNTDLITNGRDFMVKGQRKSVNTIIIKLSIADATRHVHTIHFPFEIEADTSISVATEMVAEFNLTDQDVTAIAEAIDAEIQAYVPEWVGSFEDDIDNEVTDDLEAEDVLSSLRNESNHATDGFVLQHFSSGRRYWSDSPRGSGMDSPSRLTHSNHRGDNFSVDNSPEQEDGGNNSPGQEDGDNNPPGQENGDGYSPHRTSSSNHRSDDNLEVIASFESLNLRSQSPDDSRNGTIADKDDRNDRCSDKALPESDPESFKLVSDKLEHLLIEQQEELESLRKKHDMAISDILKELPPELCRTTLSIFGLRGNEYLGQCEAGEHSGHSLDSTKTTAD